MSDPTVVRAPVVAPQASPEPGSGPGRTPRPRRARRAVGRRLPGVTGLRGITAALARIGRVGWDRALTAWERIDPVLAGLAKRLEVVSPLGWTLLVAGTASWLIARRLGWLEFSYIAAVFTILLGLSALFTIGRLRLEVRREVDPLRVVVGESAAVRLEITNRAATPLLPIGIEMAVGSAVARYTTPLLVSGASHEELTLIPTQRRGVVLIGEVKSQRGDPFGVFRREVAWTDAVEMFVHPRTVPLEPLGAGLLRDLEGRTTNEISMSDLAFHTLREYVPGDDRRYIHWRSSAKASAASGTGSFLVRQFLDTRRSHVAVVVDVNPAAYTDPEEFELALSAGASITMRAITDEMDLTVVCGEHAAVQPVPHVALDTFARAELKAWTLGKAAGRLLKLAPDASVVLLITGALTDFAELNHARALLPFEVNAVALQVRRGSTPQLRQAGQMPLIGIGSLSDLAPVLAKGGIA